MTQIELVRELILEAPYGDFTVRVDDRHRIAIPANWLHFFREVMRDQNVFVTSFDERSIRVYSESIWRFNLKVMGDNPQLVAERIALQRRAGRYGATTAPDANGRVTLNPALRAAVDAAGTDMHATCENGVLCLYTATEYEAMNLKVTGQIEGAMQSFAQLGFI
jgi:DNA-binding transcriptional regulator/RsmH inhibitor MraZ